MALLDLPLELFQYILDLAIADVTVTERPFAERQLVDRKLNLTAP
jgi:hypothetical protein